MHYKHICLREVRLVFGRKWVIRYTVFVVLMLLCTVALVMCSIFLANEIQAFLTNHGTVWFDDIGGGLGSLSADTAPAPGYTRQRIIDETMIYLSMLGLGNLIPFVLFRVFAFRNSEGISNKEIRLARAARTTLLFIGVTLSVAFTCLPMRVCGLAGLVLALPTGVLSYLCYIMPLMNRRKKFDQDNERM